MDDSVKILKENGKVVFGRSIVVSVALNKKKDNKRKRESTNDGDNSRQKKQRKIDQRIDPNKQV